MSQESPPPPSPRTERALERLRGAHLVSESDLPAIQDVLERFSLGIGDELVQLIDVDDPHDPIATQFVPRAEERQIQPEESPDPIADAAFTPVKGITHRYPDRVLLKPVQVCPVYCRFCLRREVVGPGGQVLSDQELAAALAYVRQRPAIWEVILSGGDPLVLSAERVFRIVRELEGIEHVGVIRIHTRVPVVRPERISEELLAAIRVKTPVYVVLHCNHPRELTPLAMDACARLVDAGIPMLSQSVLLRGVNDNTETLTKLFRQLVRCRVKPYYLHHCDLAQGTSHFRTTIEAGQALMRSLRGTVSGLCQPTYLLDIPGGHGKVPMGPSYIDGPDAHGTYCVEDIDGQRHTYPPLP